VPVGLINVLLVATKELYMCETNGINHLGLSVLDLDKSVSFFVDGLGWEESGRDNSYPRSAVSDGKVRLTLWQVDRNLDVQHFHRRKNNIGLHHLALEVTSEEKLNEVHAKLTSNPEVSIEFEPELVGSGPRKHMMCNEPGGIRIEFIWLGN
jgi:catechol 2,3-dioxygenase-like lactoylglutathione lyase family enzyme|tara:strand:- start:86 stop:541 length:456 start_codon:yes stop_codon:yes gene_type:complete